MKKISIFPLLIFTGNLFGQVTEPNLYEVSKSSKKIYADKSGHYIVAYEMGKYLDKAGVGSSIKRTDTLFFQTDSSYRGELFKVESMANQLYITSLTEKQSKKYALNTVENKKMAFQALNNAYYLDSYFAMSDRLNKKYELNQHSFRNGFYTWKSIIYKEINYQEFRKIARNEIRKIEDSISWRQEQLVEQAKYLVDNIETLSYAEFKDGIGKIPATPAFQSSYYKTIVNKISINKPDYVILLYKDFPENKTLIELAIEKDKALLQRLKSLHKNQKSLAKKK